jgi:hypothetical protein
MNHSSDEQFSKFVRNAIEPMGEQDLARDLWPRMLLKLQAPGISVPWFDWVLAALVVILCLFVPEAVPGLLLNL